MEQVGICIEDDRWFHPNSTVGHLFCSFSSITFIFLERSNPYIWLILSFQNCKSSCYVPPPLTSSLWLTPGYQGVTLPTSSIFCTYNRVVQQHGGKEKLLRFLGYICYHVLILGRVVSNNPFLRYLIKLTMYIYIYQLFFPKGDLNHSPFHLRRNQ